MAESRVEIIRDLFYGFNRDPHSNANLVENFCKKSVDMEPYYLRKAVDMLINNHGSLPRFVDVYTQYQKELPVKEWQGEDCNMCRGTGLVHSLFNRDDSGRREVWGLQQIPKGSYYLAVIGSCKCANGMRYSKAYKPTDVPKWITERSEITGKDCLTIVENISQHYNREAQK